MSNQVLFPGRAHSFASCQLALEDIAPIFCMLLFRYTHTHTSLMSLFGSITDREYIGFLIINLMKALDHIMMQADREHNFN